MDRYITFRDNDAQGKLQYYILQREHPHFIGRISEIPETTRFPSMPIAGYNLYVVFDYCLRGRFIPSYQHIFEEINGVMKDMSLWFLASRIQKDEKRYSKHKIKNI